MQLVTGTGKAGEGRRQSLEAFGNWAFYYKKMSLDSPPIIDIAFLVLSCQIEIDSYIIYKTTTSFYRVKNNDFFKIIIIIM